MARDAPCREPALMGCCASPAATRVCCKVRSCQPACVFSASASRVRGLKADRLLSASSRHVGFAPILAIPVARCCSPNRTFVQEADSRCGIPCSNTQPPQGADVSAPNRTNRPAFEQLVGAEVKRPGRARTGGCACACVLRRRSRWRPPARSAARPARPLLSAARSLARCGLPPAAFR